MLRLATASLFLTALAAGPAQAQEEDDPNYWTVRVGVMDPYTSDDAFDFNFGDAAVNVSGTWGRRLPWMEGLSSEVEVGTSVVKGDFNGPDYRLTTAAGYVAWRSRGPIYFRLRAGMLYEHATVGGVSDNDVGLSAGGGVGWEIAEGHTLEFDYTLIEEDVHFFSIGYRF